MRRHAPVLAVMMLLSCNSILGNHDHYLDADGGAGAGASDAGSTSAAAGASGRTSGSAGAAGRSSGSAGAGASASAGTGGDENIAGALTGGGAGDVGGTSGAGDAGMSGGGSAGRAGAGGVTGIAGGGTGGTKGSAGASGVAGAGGSGGSTSVGPLAAISGGTTGFATRFWDCCKPSCSSASAELSCTSNGTTSGDTGANACSGGAAYACYDLAPFQDTTNPYVAYAFAASSAACGACYEVQFTGNGSCSNSTSCPNAVTGLAQKTMFVQTITATDALPGEMDLLIPGGGVGAFNACAVEWGGGDLGSMYGGYPSECAGDASCVQTKCNTEFSNKPLLLAGCNWFLNWFGGANNPQVVFKAVSCPTQLIQKSGMSG